MSLPRVTPKTRCFTWVRGTPTAGIKPWAGIVEHPGVYRDAGVSGKMNEWVSPTLFASIDIDTWQVYLDRVCLFDQRFGMSWVDHLKHGLMEKQV